MRKKGKPLPADHPVHQRVAVTQRLSTSLKSLHYLPSLSVANRHLQTIVGAYLPVPRFYRERQRLELPDGDFLDVDWHDCPSAHGVMIFHGLGGSSESPYVRALQYRLRACGWGSVAINLRGASGVPNRLARAYHAGAGDDVGYAVQAVLRAARARGVSKGLWHLVGFSLGGSMLVNWWSQQVSASQLPIGLCVGVSIPLDLGQCADALNTGAGQLYQHHLLRAVKRYFRHKLAYLMQCGYREAADELKQYRSCLSARSFWEFDDVYIAPLHGFEHVRDYYESASPARHLHQGQWPLLIIQSEDDPLVPATGFPELASMPSNVHVKRFRQGGHVGFLNWVNGRLESQLPGLITRGLQLAVGL